MTVLVTGANGFVGSALVRRLLAHGEEHVRCLVRPGSDTSKLDGLVAAHRDVVEIISGTLNRREDCVRALSGGVEVLYHLAASPGGAPADMFLNSVVGTKNLLEALVEVDVGIKVVYCSSFSVYGVADLPRGATVDEETPLEPHPEERDMYSQSKLRQEQLVREYQAEHGFPLTVLRPGTVYGPGGGLISGRVGLELFGVFLHLGRGNALPLTYVDNCAEALVVAGKSDDAVGETFNVVDDDTVSSRQFLRRYRKQVKRVPVVPMPYVATQLMSRMVKWYSTYSKGQLPAIFTPYKTASMWKGNRFDNSKLKRLGWTQVVSTEEGLARHFDYAGGTRPR